MAEFNEAKHETRNDHLTGDSTEVHPGDALPQSLQRLGNLPYAVIGLVARSAGGVHGYRLKQEIECICEDSSRLTYGRLYNTLGLLASHGRLRVIECIQSGRPNRKVYQVTDSGRRCLDEWLLLPLCPDPRPLRDELSLKILFLDQTNVVALAALIEQQRQFCLTRLARLARRRKRLEKVKVAATAIDLILDAPEMRARAELAWLRQIELKISAGG